MLVKEISIQPSNTELYYAKNEIIDSIYLGGGTPSLLPEVALEKIFEVIHSHYKISEHAEITLEANPEDITSTTLEHWHSIGVNRLSIGIQSFADKDLAFMNRNHDQRISHEALDLVFASEIQNISGDLMFGLIGNSLADWQENLEKMVHYPFNHLSVYNLTIEEQTVFHHWQKKAKLNESSASLQEDQFKLASSFLSNAGFEHYEISNYAKSGFQAVHNTNYWKGVKYWGFGPSAHSYDGKRRSWNIANNARYIQQWQQDEVVIEHEELDPFDRLNEAIMLGIRTKWGIEKKIIMDLPEVISSQFNVQLKPFLESGKLIETNEAYLLSRDLWYLSDTVAADLFITKD